MNGEMISTGDTFDVGRIAINDAFSGTAEMNNLITKTLSATTVSVGSHLSASTVSIGTPSNTSDYIVDVNGRVNIIGTGATSFETNTLTTDVNVLQVIAPDVSTGVGNTFGVHFSSDDTLGVNRTFAKVSAFVESKNSTSVSGGLAFGTVSGGTTASSPITRMTIDYNGNVSILNGNFSGGTDGGIIYSGGTNLSDLFLTTGGNLWSSSTGENSIIANNGTGNLASGSYSFAIGSKTTASGAYSHAEGLSTISSGDYSHTEGANTTASGNYSHAEGIVSQAIGNYSHSEGANTTASGIASHAGGSGNTAQGLYSIVGGGKSNIVYSNSGAILTGTDNVVNDGAESSSIIAGSGNTVNASVLRSSVLAGQNITATDSDTSYTQKAYVDEYLDLNPQTTLPSPSIGRVFFSGTPLFRLMVNTGGTSSDWIIS